MAAPDIGVFLPSMSDQDGAPGDMAATARLAEDLGFESVWVVDQLIAGNGSPFIESTIALAAAATATTHIRIGLGVMILPLRPLAWVAKQVASLQHVSGDRLILGIGAGGDRHDQSWAAAGVPRRERGRRTDEALRVLPDLITGKPTVVEDLPDRPTVQLSPGATMPSVLVGGMSDAAMTRAVDFADGWFLVPMPADALGRERIRLQRLAASRHRPVPRITAGLMAAIDGDPALPDRVELVSVMTDPDGRFGVPADHVDDMLRTGDPAAIAAHLAELAANGAERIVTTLPVGDWNRQAELLAEARALLG